MIVKCNKIISPGNGKDLGDDSPWLIKGKEYLVFSLSVTTNDGIYIIIQTEQDNEPALFSANGFEFVSQYIPSSWVNVRYETEGVITNSMMPESWNYEEFFDDLEDEKPDAVALFIKEAAKMYQEEMDRAQFLAERRAW